MCNKFLFYYENNTASCVATNTWIMNKNNIQGTVNNRFVELSVFTKTVFYYKINKDLMYDKIKSQIL